VAVSTQLRRINPRFTTLADIQLAMGILLVVLLMMPAALFETAAFRPERSPESIQLLFDLSWFIFVFTVSTGVVQSVVIAVAILMDRRREPIFPRWAGYVNIWVAILFLGGSLVPFFKTGPFAWNGLFAFWIPVVVFFAWMVAMVVLIQRAADRVDDEPAKAPETELEERIAAIMRRLLDEERQVHEGRARHDARSPSAGP
jgi:membrane protein implicated in regulation of membrane protease activity